MRAILNSLALLATAFFSIQSWADSPNLESVEGVYREKTKIFAGDNQTFQGENILEIVKVDEKSAYIRVHLDAYNGHICSIFGVAELSDGHLKYDSDDVDNCTLEVNFSKENVTLIDRSYVCTYNYCGNGGSLDKIDFRVKSKRKIRYMSILKESPEYKSAIENYQAPE
jgi:hypothetical protein